LLSPGQTTGGMTNKPHMLPAEYNPLFDPKSTSTPMRHPHRDQRPHFESRVPPISTVLFPATSAGSSAGSCQMPPTYNIPTALQPRDGRSQAMKKWVEGRSHIQHLVDCDKTPPKEDCLLVFQCLMIMWCYINNYPSRLLKRFTVYDFVNFSENGTGTGSFVCAIEDGTKYKYRTGLRFNKFEKSVLTFFFKRIRPVWINALKVLKDSFDVTTIVLDSKERTQSFFYNSQGNKQLNVSRVCENFQSKMNATHKKKRKFIATRPDDGRQCTDADSENGCPTTMADPTVHARSAVRISQNEMMTMSPNSKKLVFYSDLDIIESLNGVSSCFHRDKEGEFLFFTMIFTIITYF